jgi:hypothetical protein
MGSFRVASDIDKLGILCRYRDGGLFPASHFDDGRLRKLTRDSIVEVTVRQRRNIGNHRHFFKLLHEAVDSGAVPYSDPEELLDALKMSCGLTKLKRALDGTYYHTPASISFAAKDEPAFRAFKDRAVKLLAEHYGVVVLEAA